MAYTIERLELAKKLFLKRKSPITPEPTRRQYSLRKRSSAQSTLTSWLDEDGTDDYDPKVERAQLLKRKRASKSDNHSPKRKKPPRSLIIKVHMESEAGRAYLASLPIYQDDQPDHNGSQPQPQSSPSSPPPLPPTTPPPPSPPTPTYPLPKTIKTSLVHPINIEHTPPPDSSLPCHWCTSPIYGILGLGPRTVQVLDYGDGTYLEISGDHAAEKRQSSRMCVTCALERIHILRCPAHRIIPLRGVDVETFDFGGAYEGLATAFGMYAGETVGMNTTWCALCPNPAFFGCATKQTTNVYLEELGEGNEEVGCGLVVCERCEVLMGWFGGDLGQVVRRNEMDDPDNGCRADVEFLVPGNWLYRRYVG
ncbi:hypothetical protein BO71DRAFT_472809 [Aspergillus ellipticus CBS 707.79]|uniref:C6 finger domain protein n=1 Tax=Aspergillus ellipticus CBS 707.79 TaxID=1448320 RepID=A0A319CSB8_9EURO|nr:hypothetical protein BO71DRAFT_472809 [Aspergillus ellipticus CBS 707.79]